LTPTAPADEQELAGFLASETNVIIDRLSGLLRQLEPNRPSGLLLPYGRAIGSVAVRSNILDLEGDDMSVAREVSPVCSS
jgi:hypothetical protein